MLIEFEAVTKRFGQTRACDQVSFTVSPGTIHGIVGENGAGKSTIMRLFYGMFARDSGFIRVNGRNVAFTSPSQAISHGIGMVHQHFMLIGSLSVWENIILGDERGWRISPRRTEGLLSDLLQAAAIQFSFTDKVSQLSVGQKQQIEILKLLYRKSSVLIFDEPTAVLTPQETNLLFARIRTLKREGKTILLITHKLEEILSLTDRVTVMRQGKTVGTFETGSLNQKRLSELIMGQSAPTVSARIPVEGEIIFEASGIVAMSGRCALKNIDFRIRAGEILGIAGISGNGQEELVQAIAGTLAIDSGVFRLGGKPLSRSPYHRKLDGMGIIPADRHEEAIILDFSLVENSVLGHHRERTLLTRGLLSYRKMGEHARKLIRQFDVRPPFPDMKLRFFSGGNQQKLVVARELWRKPGFIVAAYPTRGVDIGATARIHEELISARNQGAAILLISSELSEILDIADRIAVLTRGRVVHTIKNGEANAAELGLWMLGI